MSTRHNFGRLNLIRFKIYLQNDFVVLCLIMITTWAVRLFFQTETCGSIKMINCFHLSCENFIDLILLRTKDSTRNKNRTDSLS